MRFNRHECQRGAALVLRKADRHEVANRHLVHHVAAEVHGGRAVVVEENHDGDLAHAAHVAGAGQLNGRDLAADGGRLKGAVDLYVSAAQQQNKTNRQEEA